MALSPIGPHFSLPSHFLSDEDSLMDKENIKSNGALAVAAEIHGFPSEFPYEFDSYGSSSALNSPVESVMSSTETESDEEDLVNQLKRQLVHSTLLETQKLAPSFCSENQEKSWGLAGSPQSTLTAVGTWYGHSTVSSNGSPIGRSRVSSSSSPTKSLSERTDAWDLIFAAAGQVARLKMSGDGPKYQEARGLLGVPQSPMPVPAQPAKHINTGFYSYQSLPAKNFSQTQSQHFRREPVLKQHCSIWGREAKEAWVTQQNQLQQQQVHNRRSVGLGGGRCGGRPLGLPPSAWPPLQQHQHQNQQSSSGMRAVFLGGSGLKRESTGTGVFLPRRFGNTSDSRKKQGCSTVLLPARVVQALNLNFDDMGSHTPPHFNGGVVPDYEASVARRNALLSQQKRSLRPEGPMNHEILLPQEWTY